MAHQSELVKNLETRYNELSIEEYLSKHNGNSAALPNVQVFYLPYYKTSECIPNRDYLYSSLNRIFDEINNDSTIILITSPYFAADISTTLSKEIHLKLWATIKLVEPIMQENYINQNHGSILIYTKTGKALEHTKTRIGYKYCPTCDKTTKDYGGKKHLYHQYGTIISDVWKDIEIDFDKKLSSDIIKRLSDLFGIETYDCLNIFDFRNEFQSLDKKQKYKIYNTDENVYSTDSVLLNGDCLEELRKIPDNSIDFVFADPPYNLKKKYENWNDGIDIQEYFNWCDEWLTELARVLKPGCTLAILNIPQWCIRHLKHLETILDYQDWIVWEGLSMPVRMIMPAHYSILCYSKGKPRKLPGLNNTLNKTEVVALKTLKEDFCARPACIKNRSKNGVEDSMFIENVWWDIHRLKHNSRRVDHPCQLPPMFMYRLIALFTKEGEFVLDPFNGAGTTTLTAQQMNRKYVGVELSAYYNDITSNRHKELNSGIDPFRKIDNDNSIKAKNSPVERLKKQKYEVSKKELQMEIKLLSKELGHIPNKDEVKKLSKFPIEYFENYFISWGEVTAAARTTGMTENKIQEN